MSTELPFRSKKGFADVQSPRGILTQRTGPVTEPFAAAWMSTIDRDLSSHKYMGSHGISNPGQYENVNRRRQLARSISQDGYDPKSSGRRSGYIGQRISFEKAASDLFEALNEAVGFCVRFEESFREETGKLQLWAPPLVVKALWTTRIDWNGVPATDFATDPKSKPIENADYYNKHVKGLLRAWEDINFCGPIPLDALEDTGSKLSPVEVKTSIKKLQVTFQGIVELLRMVHTDSNKMRALITQLRHARDALLDIEDLWDPPKKDEQERRTGIDGEHVWSN